MNDKVWGHALLVISHLIPVLMNYLRLPFSALFAQVIPQDLNKRPVCIGE